MHIGLIAPPWVPVPPPRYGGTEVVVDNLARGLHERGHHVELFTVGESTCPVERKFLYPTAVQPMGTSVDEAAHVLAAYEALADVDLIHDNTVLGPLLAADVKPASPPIVCTHHGAFTPENLRIFAEIAKHAAVVAISHSQASFAGPIPIAAVIHHGIDLDLFRPGPDHGDYLMFMGRMSPDKGVDRAVRIARASGRPLMLVTKIREAAEREYFERDVRPLLDVADTVSEEPELDERLRLLQGARALINPITWPEPFGLVMAESLAAGTPVLAFPYGAAPEIVDDGSTGFLCRDEDEMITAVTRIDEIDRAACRAAAEQRFSLQRMATDYETLYRRLLDNSAPEAAPEGTLATEVDGDPALDVLRRAAS